MNFLKNIFYLNSYSEGQKAKMSLTHCYLSSLEIQGSPQSYCTKQNLFNETNRRLQVS